MCQMIDQIAELRANYNELGEDLVLLESLAAAARLGYEFPEEYVASGMERILDYIDQHAGEVRNMSRILSRAATQPPHSRRSSRSLPKERNRRSRPR